MSSSQLAWGKFSPLASANGMSSAFEWWSLPFDMDDADSVSISLQALAETPTGMLVVPSTTPGDGILYVAQAAGVTTVSVTHAAPAGTPPVGTPLTGMPIGTPAGVPPATTPGTNPYSAIANAITAAPWVGATNAQMAMLANQSTAVNTLVKAFPWGWGPVGSPVNSLNSQITMAAENDPLIAQTIKSLVGGAVVAAINGIMTLETCGELTAWAAFAAGPNDVGNGTLATAGASALELHVDRVAVRYGRLHWQPSAGGSVGQIAGTISLKGGSR